MIYSGAIIHHDIEYNTTQTEVEHKSEFDSQKTPQSSPLRASYGVPIVIILDKIDRVITAPHSMCAQFCYGSVCCGYIIIRLSTHVVRGCFTGTVAILWSVKEPSKIWP